MKIKLAGLVNDSIVDGPGLRLAVFAQGCPHDCPGCHNPQSHDFDGGSWMDTDEILKTARENILLDGVTLTGGEPFAQPEACAEIAKGAKQLGLNVWCYTGYTIENLIEGSNAQKMLLQEIDVLVDGPFVLAEKTLDKRFRGSVNQRIINVSRTLSEGKIVLSELN